MVILFGNNNNNNNNIQSYYVAIYICIVYVILCIYNIIYTYLWLMLKQGLVNLADDSCTSKNDWRSKESRRTYLPQPLVYDTSSVFINFCLLSCVFGWILPSPPIHQYQPFLQGHSGLCKEAILSDGFRFFAGRTVPTDAITYVPSLPISHGIATGASRTRSKKTFAPHPSNDCWSATPDHRTYNTL